MVANEKGERNGESEDGGAEEVRAAKQVGAVAAQGLHGWALGPREDVGAVPVPLRASASFGDDAGGMGSPKARVSDE